MKCPKCKTRLTCYDTKAVEDQIVKRRYKCKKCTEKIQTIEKLMLNQDIQINNSSKKPSNKILARHTIEDMNLLDLMDDPLFDYMPELDLNIMKED